MSKRVPETCAVCNDAEKWPDDDNLVWICDHEEAKKWRVGTIVSSTRRRKLPVPPAWCPKRGGKHGAA
jgi:hypothetical protein